MAISGDWVTPRLNGLKYFEKPPLQYWMTAGALRGVRGARMAVRGWLPALLGLVRGACRSADAGARIAGPTTGVYAALRAWRHASGISASPHLVTLDAVLTGWLAVASVRVPARAARRHCRRNAADAGCSRHGRRSRWRDAHQGAGRARHSRRSARVVYAGTRDLAAVAAPARWSPASRSSSRSDAPWFVLVSRDNPEFAQFFFVHEHFERFLTTEAPAGGPWWYFVPLLVVGLLPWVGLFALDASRAAGATRRATRTAFRGRASASSGALFVFVFFSASGSKLPSYILPMFPALALVLGWQLRTLSDGALAALLLLLGALSVLTALGAVAPTMPIVRAFADAQTPLAVYDAFRPWLYARPVAHGAQAALLHSSRRAAGWNRDGRLHWRSWPSARWVCCNSCLPATTRSA